MLVLLNIGEDDIARRRRSSSPTIAAGYDHHQALVEALSARSRWRSASSSRRGGRLPGGPRARPSPSLERVIRLSYRLLGLISFFTAGPDETRAWTIPDGATAVDAAGAIHSDLARGFIRAEIVGYEDLLALGSMAEARKAGQLRSEGKTYRIATATCSRSSSAASQFRRPPSGSSSAKSVLYALPSTSSSRDRHRHRPRLVLVIREVDLELGRKFSLSSVETFTEATSRSSLTWMKPWSRSSSTAIASMRVSCT